MSAHRAYDVVDPLQRHVVRAVVPVGVGGASVPAKLVAALSAKVRIAIIAVVSVVVCTGVVLYFPFQTNLTPVVTPPPTSFSGLGHAAYERYFNPDPIQVIGLLSSNDGSPLVNVTEMQIRTNDPHCPWKLPPVFNVTSPFCPLQLNDTTTALSVRAAAVSTQLGKLASAYGGTCEVSFMSYWNFVPATSTLPKQDVRALNAVLGWLAESQLFNKNGSTTLLVATFTKCQGHYLAATCVTQKKPWCASIPALSKSWREFGKTGSYDRDALNLKVVSFPDIYISVQDGVEMTMLVSTLSSPLAFAVLACMLKNVRLLVITLVNIAGCATATVTLMFFISSKLEVSAECPALMVAVALAMSIDYSLFLLTRFSEELHKHGRTVEEAVIKTLETSGHTVLISGATLTLCFLGMLLIPVSTIATMGVAAAITVVFAIVFALVFTPTLLLTFPDFFAANRRYGLTMDAVNLPGCRQGASAARVSPATVGITGSLQTTAVTVVERHPQKDGQQRYAEHGHDASDHGTPGLWPRIGAFVQAGWAAPLLVLLALGAAAVPFAIPLSKITYVEGVLPLLPRGGDTTEAFLSMQDNFGIDTVFSNQLVLVPPSSSSLTDVAWQNAACKAMQNIAGNVTNLLQAQGLDYTMANSDFSGVMIQDGLCIGWIAGLLGKLPEPIAKTGKQLQNYLLLAFGNAAHTATKVKVATSLDPFSADGKLWITAVRDAMLMQKVVDTVPIGDIYFTGMAQEQMDGARDTFDSLPRVILATLVIVCIVLGTAFRSVFVPLRAVLCLVWMLVVTFGSATLVYQMGDLAALGLGGLAPSEGAIFWMSPCIAFSMVVGLGLDYDVFFMESVVEFYDEGLTGKEAVVKALDHTGNTICVAGVIMVLAFAALLAGSTAALNQIGFLMIVGVLIDCFVTTKIIIPCAMALVPEAVNFWPRKQPVRTGSGSGLFRDPSMETFGGGSKSGPTSPLLGEHEAYSPYLPPDYSPARPRPSRLSAHDINNDALDRRYRAAGAVAPTSSSPYEGEAAALGRAAGRNSTSASPPETGDVLLTVLNAAASVEPTLARANVERTLRAVGFGDQANGVLEKLRNSSTPALVALGLTETEAKVLLGAARMTPGCVRVSF